METTMTHYEKQVQDFLRETGTEVKIKFVEYAPYFPGEKESRDIYRVTLRRCPPGSARKRSYTTRFGASITDTELGQEPTAYDVLACLEKSDPGTFEEFCSEYGYSDDSIKATKLYGSVVRE